MTVSVIVPTYNYGRFLPDALESVRGQTYQDWECIVLDDGSTDATAEIVRAVAANDGRVKYLSQANRGPNAARNRGIAESSGEFIQFLDADDILPPTKLEAQVRALEADPSVGIVYSDARYFNDSPTNLLPYRVPGPRPSTIPGTPAQDPLLRALIHNNIMVIEGPLSRRSVITTVGSLDESLARMEDWQYWLRCALSGVRFIADSAEESAVRVRAHTDNSTRNLLAMSTGELSIRRWLDGQLDDAGLRRLNGFRTHETMARAGVLEAKEGRLREGARYLLRAGAAERRVGWLLLACGLPLLRLPGRDRLLALRRRLLRMPRMW
jgi:glycosyltransferase involved in cell wall biosynthesis